MKEYHKINSIYMREPQKPRSLLFGQFSCPEFELLKDAQWQWTEKVDGTNIRIHWDPVIGDIDIRGRTDAAQLPTELYSSIRQALPPEKLKAQFPTTEATLYGEGYGPKIQKGGELYRDDQSFVLFDVRIGHYWLQRSDCISIAEALHLLLVPVIKTCTLMQILPIVASCPNSLVAKHSRQIEGVVGTPVGNFLDRSAHRIITKLKCTDFHDTTSCRG